MIGIVICHKNMANEIVNTAKAIVGHKEDLYSFSNDKLDSKDLCSQIQQFIESNGAPESVIFMVDLRGGNCWTVARILQHENAGYYVISGVNLPMIFSFLTKKNEYSVSELVNILKKDAHRGIVID
jgi:mannose/fructose-specific phosphotransferase system component IIA